jgi:hypothetical protein
MCKDYNRSRPDWLPGAANCVKQATLLPILAYYVKKHQDTKGELMKRTFLLLCLSLVLIFSACSKAPESTARVEVIDGIEYVRNVGLPVHPDISLSLEEELAIGGEDEDGNPVLYQAGEFIVDDSGNIYVIDHQDHNIKVFDPQGNFKQTIGGQGEGPGEFQYLGTISFLPDGRLMVLDYMARRTSLFDLAGQFLSSFQWTKSYSRLILTTPDSFFIQEFVQIKDADSLTDRKLVVDEIDLQGNELSSFGEFVTAVSKLLNLGDLTIGIRVPHSAQSIFTGDQNLQRIYHMVNRTYMIETYETTGVLQRKVERPYDPLPYTSQDKEEFLARYEESSNQEIKKLVNDMDFPAVKNPVERLLCDDLGNLWVQTYETREDGNFEYTAYDRFDRDGIYEAKIWFKVRPEIIKNGMLYAQYEDKETGYTYVKRYSMLWSR